LIPQVPTIQYVAPIVPIASRFVEPGAQFEDKRTPGRIIEVVERHREGMWLTKCVAHPTDPSRVGLVAGVHVDRLRIKFRKITTNTKEAVAA
jgi:hypothetical protein